MLERTQPQGQAGPDDVRRADDYKWAKSSGAGYAVGFVGAHPN